jgi:hypothetical protein
MASRLLRLRNLHHALGDQRTRDGGAQQIAALIDRARADHGKYEVARELLAQIVHVALQRAALLRLGLETLQLLFLAHVRGEADDFRLIRLLDPLEDDRGVQTARIRQYNFHGVLLKTRHV